MGSSPPSAQQWLKIAITCDSALIEAIEDFLVGITGASVEQAAEQSAQETTIHAWFGAGEQEQEEIKRLLAQLTAYFKEMAEIFSVPVPVMSHSFIADEDWSANWKKHFSPFAIIPGLIIAPTWEPYLPQGQEKVIVMDPGMAFGTGHHATTALSLQLLQEALRVRPAATVLDVGAGTGILGMAAALFGAARVMAIDNDPEAVRAARENCQRNGLQQVMTVAITPLASLAEPFSVVVANIIHDTLLELAPDLARLTAPHGQMILSGILAGPQAASIIDHFRALGFSLERQEQKKEWAALLLVKKQSYHP